MLLWAHVPHQPTEVKSMTLGTTLTEAGSKSSGSEDREAGKDIILFSYHERVGSL